MSYVISAIFVIFIVSSFYIFQMNRRASAKRKAFRWWLATFSLFLVTLFSLTTREPIFLVVLIPVITLISLLTFKFTKFCDWCGRMVKTNLPFNDQNVCPRCGSSIS